MIEQAVAYCIAPAFSAWSTSVRASDLGWRSYPRLAGPRRIFQITRAANGGKNSHGFVFLKLSRIPMIAAVNLPPHAAGASQESMELRIVGLAVFLVLTTWLLYRLAARLQVKK